MFIWNPDRPYNARSIRVACIALLVSALLSPTPTLARAHQMKRVQENGFNCALASQRAVAQRRHLSTQPNDPASLGIYANPKSALEADNAFDACVRKHAGGR